VSLRGGMLALGLRLGTVMLRAGHFQKEEGLGFAAWKDERNAALVFEQVPRVRRDTCPRIDDDCFDAVAVELSSSPLAACTTARSIVKHSGETAGRGTAQPWRVHGQPRDSVPVSRHDDDACDDRCGSRALNPHSQGGLTKKRNMVGDMSWHKDSDITFAPLCQ
jgi:hypothetical protein